MALTRKFLASKGIEADVIEEIITAHTESISGLKDSIDEYKKYESKAKELDAVQKELDDLKAKVAENSDKDYDKLKQEFDAYKADVEEKATRNAKETAYKALLKDVGVPERHFDKILKYSKETLDKLVLDEDGNIQSTEIEVFVKYKYLDLEGSSISYSVIELADEYVIRMMSGGFAAFVELDLLQADAIFSDNYFHLTSKREKTVRLKKSDIRYLNPNVSEIQNRYELEQQLVIRTLKDTY